MKKLSAVSLSIVTFLSCAATALGQGTGVDINIPPPEQGISPDADPGVVISNAITIVFILAMLLVLVFIIIGAFLWITSGGDKEKTGKARGMITNALIGLVILSLAFLIVNVVGGIVNIDVLDNLHIPSLDEGAL